MSTKKICILGAGYGGVHAAKLLNKKFKKDSNVEITLINKQPYHALLTELHEVAGGRTETDSVKVNLEKIFGKTKVNLSIDEVTEIDFKGQVLKSDENEYKYDYLVLGSGSEPTFYGVEGAAENSFTIWSYDDAIKIREHIERMFEKASTENNAEKRKELLTFAVAGGGFTGVETIGEIAEWSKKLCRDYNLDRKEVRLIVADALPKILPILDDKLIKKSEKRLQKMGVEIFTGSAIKEVNKKYIILGEDNKIPTRTLIWAAGVQANQFTKNLGLTLGARGRVVTNEFMQTVDYKNVFIVGDNVDFEEEGKKLPQIVETALQTAETVVHNITNDIKGNSKEMKAHESNYHGIMVSIGSRYAVATLMNKNMSGFIAMAMKHLVNLHYLFGVGGFNLVWTYLMHEFFHIKENRSMVGSHFSYHTPNFWLVPLRIFLGVHWLIEGINKVKEGWLTPGNIFIVTMPDVSGASEAVDASANAVQPLLSHPPAIYQWFMDTIVTKVAFPMQVMVVLTEIGIGLALIAGLFTMIAAIVSIFLTFNFIISAMAGAEILWYTFAGIALIGGGGRALGLDYYVMPWLKERWNKTKLARKNYIYID